jgi:RNA-dependent RNA polymerase
MPLKRMLVGSRRIRSSKSNRLPRREVLEGITCLPYINPNAAEEREKRVTLLQSKNVSIKTIQFGWECRNKVFSIKWEEYCEGSCYLSFDGERREICIEISRPPDTIFISMRLSQLRFVSPHSYLHSEPIKFLVLLMPQVFGSQTIPGVASLLFPSLTMSELLLISHLPYASSTACRVT